jgi:hypothetical protein
VLVMLPISSMNQHKDSTSESDEDNQQSQHARPEIYEHLVPSFTGGKKISTFRPSSLFSCLSDTATGLYPSSSAFMDPPVAKNFSLNQLPDQDDESDDEAPLAYGDNEDNESDQDGPTAPPQSNSIPLDESAVTLVHQSLFVSSANDALNGMNSSYLTPLSLACDAQPCHGEMIINILNSKGCAAFTVPPVAWLSSRRMTPFTLEPLR